jgi:hypothetical protein
VLGFDAEWVEVAHKPEDEQDQSETSPPHNNKILSYQIAGRTFSGHEWAVIVFPHAGQAVLHPDMSEEELEKIPERVRFADLIGIVISEGIRLGHLTCWPRKPITVAGHWTRTDLTAMADFAEIKSEFDGVQNTYVTANPLMGLYRTTTSIGKHSHELTIRLLDTWLLVPEGSKGLGTLGEMYNYPKLKVGTSPDGRNYIECMDQLLRDDPDLFKRYAIRDAEITARHVDELSRFAGEELGVGNDGLPCTLSGLSVANLLKQWEELEIDRLKVNGLEIKTLTKWDAANHKTKYFKAEVHVDGYRIHEQIAKDCMHGGRNECFWFGPTPPPQDGVLLREFDLVSAYATALCSLQIPDYSNAYTVRDAEEFTEDQLGFARISFRFPPSTRYPCLPVEADKGRGLIFPLVGMAWVTAPEIVLALSLGAEITVHHGVIIPWVKDSPHIFEPVIKDLMVRREQHPKGSLQNALYKLLGNGLYGKTCQGLAGNIAFDTRADVHKEIPESRITNPFLAAHVTGLTRALVSEFMASVPRQRTVYSVTTDGFITDALLLEMSMKGPIATHMMKVRRRLVPEGRAVELLETNYRAEQLLLWRTRGVATIARPEGTPPKLARGGMQAPRGEDANEWIVRKMLERKPFDTFTSKEKSPFPHAHRANEDFAIRDKEKVINFEPDFKRELIEPRMTWVELSNGERVQHLTCGTRP